MARTMTPFFWSLFSAGGALTALLFPVHLFLTGVAYPLGWMDAPAHDVLLDLVRRPITRFYLFSLISLALFNWAHRFRYLLYDGFKLKHLAAIIKFICYGGALFGTCMAGYLLWTLG